LTSERFGHVLTIEEHYWNRFNRFSRNGRVSHAYVSSASILKSDVKQIFFCSVRQHKDLLGYADFVSREVGEPTTLWSRFGHETCLNSFDEYLRLTRGKRT